MRILTVMAVVFGAGFAGAAQAQSGACDTAITQMEMNVCASNAFDAADKDLNAAYARARSAMRRIDGELSASQAGAETALRDAQRAWITFRDNACLAEGFQMRGGSAEPLLVFDCKARLTEQRAQDLWTLAAGIEG